MSKIFLFYQTHKKNCYLWAGLFLSCLFMVPYVLLGTGSIITYHDQLDGELFSYILTARYLFTDIHIYPEIMNGLPATGAVPPAPLFVLFYVFFKPFTAFILSQWFIYIIGFLGMYFLLLLLTRREFISFGIAVIFMLLPFYPVYGLCIPGQPLLLYAILSLSGQELLSAGSLAENGSFRKKIVFSFLIVFYGVSSSLVLVGFACLLLLGLSAICQTIHARFSHKRILRSLWFSTGILLLTYLTTNFGLLKQVLFPRTSYVSHKTEMVLSPQDSLSCFQEAFTNGISYAQSYHTPLIVPIFFCILLILFRFFRQNRRPLTKEAKTCLFTAFFTGLFILIICLFYAFYHGSLVTDLRNASQGVFKTFNLDRVCWLLPTAWCILAASLFYFIADDSKYLPSFPARLSRLLILIFLCIWCRNILLHSSLRPNLSKLANLLKGQDYYALDWDSFFAEDIYRQIDKAIGRPKNDYHVISVGVYPAAAAYNDFYCLDGYSNNYPLEYKHTFRQIMEGELEKSDYVRDFFDNWGNRCYITTAEQANYYTFEKKWNSVIQNLDLNTELLKELDCDYIFSAARIMNSDELGLSLIREEPFETEKSWYHIYVYQLN